MTALQRAVPKLLAIDMDGTLLTSERRVHPDNIGALRRAREAGIEVVLASGRLLTSMLPYAEQLDLRGPFICCNGAHIVDADAEIFHAGLDPRMLQRAYAYAIANGLHLNVYARTEIYFSSESHWGDLYRRRAGVPIHPKVLEPSDLDTLEATKLMFIGEEAAVSCHATALTGVLEGLEYRFTESEPGYLELLSPYADKGLALRHLARLRGLDRTEVAAIGDYLNDLEMIRFAGTSAAIGNAIAEVRLAANSVVCSNDRAGVAEFVDSLIVNGRE